MDHRKKVKKRAWDFLRDEIAPDIALVQEAYWPDELGEGERFVYPESDEIPVKLQDSVGASGI
jgi:hypothetical protein